MTITTLSPSVHAFPLCLDTYAACAECHITGERCVARIIRNIFMTQLRTGNEDSFDKVACIVGAPTPGLLRSRWTTRGKEPL